MMCSVLTHDSCFCSQIVITVQTTWRRIAKDNGTHVGAGYLSVTGQPDGAPDRRAFCAISPAQVCAAGAEVADLQPVGAWFTKLCLRLSPDDVIAYGHV